MRRVQSVPSLRARRNVLLPPVTLGVLLCVIVATNDGCRAAARETQPSTCGRQFLVRQGNANNSSGSDEAAAVAGELSLSRGRGFMGAAMVDEPPLVVLAGGIGVGGKLVDSNVDAFALPSLRKDGGNNLGGGRGGGGAEGALVYKDVLS